MCTDGYFYVQFHENGMVEGRCIFCGMKWLYWNELEIMRCDCK